MQLALKSAHKEHPAVIRQNSFRADSIFMDGPGPL